MKYLAGFLAGMAAAMPLALGAQSTGFDDMVAGTAPAGWILTVTGKGSPWSITHPKVTKGQSLRFSLDRPRWVLSIPAATPRSTCG